MKIFNKSFIFKITILLLLLILFICISAISYADAISNDIANSVFRLHVIANSDSEYDQVLKLKVRDALLDYMNIISSNVTTKTETMQVAQSHIENFKEIAQKVVISEGYDYNVDVEIGCSSFPTKVYGDITLPCGTYDALKVKIGTASGHNWWCVMFPPLCFVDVTSGTVPDDSKDLLKESLEDDEYKIITANNSSYNSSKLRFKIVELVEQLKSKI